MKQPSLINLVLAIAFVFFISSNAFAEFSKTFEGYTVFQNYCVICHGKEGKGNGPLAKKLSTK
ncbi:MAG: cytochrome c, partial [Gammaproteobacteria bacterium]|nr:cytochrome c [Gammaproteobacteria bacterium]